MTFSKCVVYLCCGGFRVVQWRILTSVQVQETLIRIEACVHIHINIYSSFFSVKASGGLCVCVCFLCGWMYLAELGVWFGEAKLGVNVRSLFLL